MSKTIDYYYEAREEYTGGGCYYQALVYHYDKPGKKIIDFKTGFEFLTEDAALEVAAEWCYDNNIDAKLS